MEKEPRIIIIPSFFKIPTDIKRIVIAGKALLNDIDPIRNISKTELNKIERQLILLATLLFIRRLIRCELLNFSKKWSQFDPLFRALRNFCAGNV